MPNIKVGIVDYSMGNLFSILQATHVLGLKSSLINHPEQLFENDAIILPGVGAFGRAVENLRKNDMLSALKEFHHSGNPIFGICLGFQLFFSESHEYGEHKGLDLIKGNVERFPAEDEKGDLLRVPNIGWRKLLDSTKETWGNSPLQSVRNEDYFYFVHSYFVKPETPLEFVAISKFYNFEFVASIKHNNIFGTQFHPEKSGPIGLKIIENWVSQIKRGQ